MLFLFSQNLQKREKSAFTEGVKIQLYILAATP